MTAKKIALPNEDPAAVADRNREGADHFRTARPRARHLRAECGPATLLADRSHPAHATAVANQILDRGAKWEGGRRQRVAALRRRGEDAPAGAVAELRSFPHGCHWLA